jgi:branched-chain amino acid transport system ATP-binding protein
VLTVEKVNCLLAGVQVLRDLSLELRTGEVLCLLGRNGAGKTTTLRAIMGLVPPTSGEIRIDDTLISGLPAHKIPAHRISYVPQGRRLFAELTVMENLQIGLMARNTGKDALDAALEMFPVLRERLNQVSGTLSGGEQQMLAMARALCTQPRVLLLDEPTEGLMPSMIAAIRDSVASMRDNGVSTLLVEQRVEAVLPVADRVAFMENGRIRDTVGVEKLHEDPALVERYVGVGTAG